MEPKSNRILTSVKLYFLLPVQCEINVFAGQDPSKNDTKSLKKRLCNQPPPEIFNFQPQVPLDGNMSRQGYQRVPSGGAGSTKNSSKRDPKCGREPTPQNGPSFSPNGCQNGFPKRFKSAQILSKEVSRNVLNETNSGK